MKVYQVSKKYLKWKEIEQINYPWNLPILVDKDYNVIMGSSLKNVLSEQLLVVVLKEPSEGIRRNLFEIESAIAVQKDLVRVDSYNKLLYRYLKDTRYINEQLELLDYRDTNIITEENYKIPPLRSFRNNKDDKTKKIEEDFDIDLSIMEELL